MRRVARRLTTQTAWKVAQQGNLEFFPVESVHELDVHQLTLVHWVRFYEQVKELGMDERPSDKQVADDRLLDEWYDRREQDVVKRSEKNVGGRSYTDPANVGGKNWTPEGG